MEDVIPPDIWSDKSNRDYIREEIKQLIDTQNEEKQITDIVNSFIKTSRNDENQFVWSEKAIDLFKKLAAFEIIVPLTGKDNEWIKIGNNTWQNKRCSHVFKDTNGKAYDIFGKIIREPNGCCYTNKDSNVFIEFPYTPKREYIEMSRTISE